ncbi:MAG: hypothetical protein CME64_02535 [Halobacteriovoraceae bacterium]|nr:hypothetical protein [Halobacteriovoraceae bacterium]|tara:strand:+ start:18003 stop:18740 length:738 start_codon:yes stop_codon:yes gene_type:complete
MKAALLILTTIFLSSCSSYVKSLHKQINRENRVQRSQALQNYYQQHPGMLDRTNDRRPIQNPVTLGGQRTPKNLMPRVKRQYGNPRARAEDLKDNDDSGSLWSGKNSESFLFVTNNIKRPGDIVIIDVLSKLKDDITEELKRAYPDPPKKKKGQSESAETAEETQAATEPSAEGKDQKVHDKISTQVVESVNKDYLLVRGRKEVLFKEAKRYVEIQALVSRKDISDNDTVKSDRILEPKIRVLRY